MPSDNRRRARESAGQQASGSRGTSLSADLKSRCRSASSFGKGRALSCPAMTRDASTSLARFSQSHSALFDLSQIRTDSIRSSVHNHTPSRANTKSWPITRKHSNSVRASSSRALKIRPRGLDESVDRISECRARSGISTYRGRRPQRIERGRTMVTGGIAGRNVARHGRAAWRQPNRRPTCVSLAVAILGAIWPVSCGPSRSAFAYGWSCPGT